MYKVGQIIRNKRSKLQRRVSKVVKDTIYWISKDGIKKGKCSVQSLNRLVAGKDK